MQTETYCSMPLITPLPDEEWRQIPGLDFWCSSLGRFAYKHKDKLYLRKLSLQKGRLLFRFRLRGTLKSTAVVAKTAIARTFIPHSSKSTMAVQCINGDETDIRLSNLRWVTLSEATRLGIANKEDRHA